MEAIFISGMFLSFVIGGLFGISAYPVRFGNGSKLGFYVDAYRGSQIYEDYYNQKVFETPGSNFVKGGIRCRLKKKCLLLIR